MKKLILYGMILFSVFASVSAKSQVRVSLSVNISSQPVWGPTGYDHVDYYYLPDIEAYYYVPSKQFIYQSGGRWIRSTSLPARYKKFDLNTSYKVVMNEPKPYLHFKEHKAKYAQYRGNHSQPIIRNSDEPKYYVVKGHPKYHDPHKNNNHHH